MLYLILKRSEEDCIDSKLGRLLVNSLTHLPQIMDLYLDMIEPSLHYNEINFYCDVKILFMSLAASHFQTEHEDWHTQSP